MSVTGIVADPGREHLRLHKIRSTVMVEIYRDSIRQFDAVDPELRIECAALSVSEESNELAGIVRDGVPVQVRRQRTILAVFKFSGDNPGGHIVQSNVADSPSASDVAPNGKQVRFAIQIYIGDIKMSEGCAFQTNSKQAGRQKAPIDRKSTRL